MNLGLSILILHIGLAASQRCVIKNLSTDKGDFLTEAMRVLRESNNCETLVFQNIRGDLHTSILYSIPTNITELEISQSNISYTVLCSYLDLRKIAILDNIAFPTLDESVTASCDNIAVLELSNVDLNYSAFNYMSQLQVLDMRNMKIRYLTREYTRSLHNLMFLRIVNSEIQRIQPGVICPPSLRRLNLKSNKVFPNISISLLDSCFNLESLVIYGKYNLDEDAFNTMAKLEKLYVVETRIDYLSDNYFRALSRLVLLDLEENSIKAVHEDAFANLINLEMLNLKYSEIENIPPGLFRNQEKLEVLSLTGNKIKSLHEIKNLPSLKMLDVSWNSITEIDDQEVRENLPALNQLYIFGNHMPCWYTKQLKYAFEVGRRINLRGYLVEDEASCL